jgi:hypothetical protein
MRRDGQIGRARKLQADALARRAGAALLPEVQGNGSQSHMTTMAALFAGIPLVIAAGPGTELRRRASPEAVPAPAE